MIGFSINMVCATINVAIWSATDIAACLIFAAISAVVAVGCLIWEIAT